MAHWFGRKELCGALLGVAVSCKSTVESTPDLEWISERATLGTEAHWKGAMKTKGEAAPDVRVNSQRSDLHAFLTASGMPEGTELKVGEQTSKVERGTAIVEIDLSDLLGAVPASVVVNEAGGLHEIPMAVSVTYPGSRTVSSKLKLTDIHLQVIQILKQATTRPVPFNGITPEGDGMLLGLGDRLDLSSSRFEYALLGSAKNAAGIGVVALVDYPEVEHHPCGPYVPKGGGAPEMHEVFIQGTRVRAFDRVAGKVLLDKTLRGRPPCPSIVSRAEHQVTGEAEADRLLKKFVTDKLGSVAGVPNLAPSSGR